MEKPQCIIPSLCQNYHVSKNTFDYTSRDIILYALSLNVSSNPLEDLEFTYEMNENFKTIVSFATIVPCIKSFFTALMNCPGIPNFNLMQLLHAEEKLRLFGEIRTFGRVNCLSYIKHVEDKKKGALIVICSEGSYADCESRLFIKETHLFIRGLGGFSSQDSSKNLLYSETSPVFLNELESVPRNSIRCTIDLDTMENQALLYRLNGDLNPLHADPAMANIAGFSKPILHGLCTYGIATICIQKYIQEMSPSYKVKCIQARFNSPVTPGDTLKLTLYNMPQNEYVYAFDVLNLKSNSLCLTNGFIEFGHDYNVPTSKVSNLAVSKL